MLIFIYLIYNAIVNITLYIIVSAFFEKRKVSMTVVLSLLLFAFVFSSALHLLFNAPLINLLNTLLTLYLFTLCFENSLSRRMFVILCTFMITALSEIIGWTFMVGEADFGFFSGVDIHVLTLLFSGVILVSSAYLLHNMKNILGNTPLKFKSNISFAFIIFFFLFTFLLVGNIFSLSPQVLTSIFVTSAFLFIAHFFYFVVLDFFKKDREKAKLQQQETEYYLSQLELMQKSVEQVKSVRHDMKSHLTMAKNLSSSSITTTEYLDSVLTEINKSTIVSETGNMAIDGLVNFKLNDEIKSIVKVEAKILVPQTLNVEMIDIVAILGNLLDNALEALSKVDDKFLRLDIEYNNDTLLIKVENTFDGVVKYCNKNKNIVSRKVGSNHGYGLKNIQKSVEKYNGIFDVSHADNIFSVSVLLYIDNLHLPKRNT